jgi:hypothetical protein
LLGDVKLFDPLGGEPAKVERHGALAGFANTLPVAKRKMFGLAANKDARAANSNRSTGMGSWEAFSGDCDVAIRRGCELQPLLFETFGGFSPGVMDLLGRLDHLRSGRLTPAEYREASWSTRKWRPFATQRLSVQLHMAAAGEIRWAFESAAAMAWMTVAGAGRRQLDGRWRLRKRGGEVGWGWGWRAWTWGWGGVMGWGGAVELEVKAGTAEPRRDNPATDSEAAPPPWRTTSTGRAAVTG